MVVVDLDAARGEHQGGTTIAPSEMTLPKPMPITATQRLTTT